MSGFSMIHFYYVICAFILIFRLQIFRKKYFTAIEELWRFWAMEYGEKRKCEL